MKRKLSEKRNVRFAFEEQRFSYNDPEVLEPLWYSPKDLRALHDDVKSIIGMKPSLHPQYVRCQPSMDLTEVSCFRGLEYFASNARRELRKHFVKGLIETQRRLKKLKPNEGSKDMAEVLQELAEKHSQYAKDRAREIALSDAIDSRAILQDDEAMIASCTSKSRAHRHHTPPRRHGLPNTTTSRTA